MLVNVILFFILTKVNASPFFLDGEWKIKSSSVSYKVFHLIHDAEVNNKFAEGKVSCNQRFNLGSPTCTFEVLLDLKDFISPEKERDRRFLEVTNYSKFPKIKIKGQVKQWLDTKMLVQANIEISGKSKAQNIELNFNKKWKAIQIDGVFEVKASEFEIERPTLLGFPIEDRVQIKIVQEWEKWK